MKLRDIFIRKSKEVDELKSEIGCCFCNIVMVFVTVSIHPPFVITTKVTIQLPLELMLVKQIKTNMLFQ